MLSVRFAILVFYLVCGLERYSFAAVYQISEAEFRALAKDLGPKVNLFREAWAIDPDAEFFGGTTRDYLYWIKGKFKDANNRADAVKITKQLRALPSIELREFIIGESDVDVITQRTLGLSAGKFGITKLDALSPDIFNPTTPAGFNELNQGHIPVEKIRLGKKGLVDNLPFGDGAKEIYEGKLTVQFPDPKKFIQTTYAVNKENHEILLALRFIRVHAMNYFQTYGQGFPDEATLLAGISKKNKEKLMATVELAIKDFSLAPYLEQKRFRIWLNATIQKAFRSYTNPTAALQLMKYFHVDQLVSHYAGELEPINQYVFAKHRNDADINGRLKSYGVKTKKFFIPVVKAFPDGRAYHGTKKDQAFRGILLQGVMQSESGTAGAGLYVVSKDNVGFAEEWGGDKNRVVSFAVKPSAKIADLSNPEVAQAFERFSKSTNQGLEEFADAFGIDILKYEYGNVNAFVVKNSAAINKPEGLYRKVLPFSKILLEAKGVSDLSSLLKLAELNSLTDDEMLQLFASAKPDTLDLLTFHHQRTIERNYFSISNAKLWEKIISKKAMDEEKLRTKLSDIMLHDRGNEMRALWETVISKPGWEKHPEIVDLFLVLPGAEKDVSYLLSYVLSKDEWSRNQIFEFK